MYPDAPELGLLRIASLADVPRVAVVATGGFRYSPVFEWERPYHKKYPEDTLISYRAIFADMIRNPDYIVLVTSDGFDPNEYEKTSAMIPIDSTTEPHIKGETIVVGVASWKLEPQSKRMGQLQSDQDISVDFEKGSERDRNTIHVSAFGKTCDAAEKKYFGGYALMEMVVVHPAYWNRGHGSRLVRWGMALSDMDQCRQGVIAADMGAKLYLQLGYEKLCDVQLDDDQNAVEGVTIVLAKYVPKEPIVKS